MRGVEVVWQKALQPVAGEVDERHPVPPCEKAWQWSGQSVVTENEGTQALLPTMPLQRNIARQKIALGGGQAGNACQNTNIAAVEQMDYGDWCLVSLPAGLGLQEF